MSGIEKPKYWPLTGDAGAAVALLRREELWHLAGYDGCLCANCAIMGFSIEVSCRKSTNDGSTHIKVGSRRLGTLATYLVSIADEIEKQILRHEPNAAIIREYIQE